MNSKSYTELEIINGCLKNDRKFQEILYRKYYGKMMAMIYRHTSDTETAMTILNDGFLRVFKKLDKYSFKGSFEGWIRRLVYHSVADYFRKENKYLKYIVFDIADRNIEGEVLPELYVEDILKMVERLPKASRSVFKMYAIEGFSHREISQKLSISEGTSKWHLSEARKRLKDLINKNNYSYHHAG